MSLVTALAESFDQLYVHSAVCWAAAAVVATLGAAMIWALRDSINLAVIYWPLLWLGGLVADTVLMVSGVMLSDDADVNPVINVVIGAAIVLVLLMMITRLLGWLAGLFVAAPLDPSERSMIRSATKSPPFTRA